MGFKIVLVTFIRCYDLDRSHWKLAYNSDYISEPVDEVRHELLPTEPLGHRLTECLHKRDLQLPLYADRELAFRSPLLCCQQLYGHSIDYCLGIHINHNKY